MKSCCDEYCSTHGCNQGRDCPVRIKRIRKAKEHLDADDAWGWIDNFRQTMSAVCIALIVVWAVWQIANVWSVL